MAKARGDSIGLSFVDAVLLHTHAIITLAVAGEADLNHYLYCFFPLWWKCVCAHAHVRTCIDVVEGEGSENEAFKAFKDIEFKLSFKSVTEQDLMMTISLDKQLIILQA